MLYRILLNFCVWQETILHNMTTLSESKSVKNVGIINDWPFLYRHFCMKIDRILRIAHASSTIDSWCFIGSVVTFAFNKRTYCTTKQRWQNQNRFKNVGVIHERPFLHRHFSMKIDIIFKNCSCFIDYRLLMLYRILLNLCIQQEDILHYLTTLTELKSVQKCRSYSRLTLSSSAFFYENWYNF